MTQNQSQKFVIPIGPQHPALKEPGHFEFTVDGEVVTDVSARFGFVHRGMEKGVENLSWNQGLYLMERVCGICSHVHAMAFALGVEKLAKVEAPPRAQAIRVLVAELERIHSHLLWLGVAAHEGGFDTLFMYSWRDRETVMDLLEEISGNRVNYSANILGGVKIDISQKQADSIKQGIDFLEDRCQHYLKVVTEDETFLGRTRNIGVMTHKNARKIGAIGTTARASGIKRDIRVEAPYAGYIQFPVHIVTEKTGDLESRFVVRIKELYESFRVIREILDHMPEGELSVKVPRRIPEGETVSRVEAPRGELFYFMKSNGSDKPERVKVRTPSLCNWDFVLNTAIGHKLADMPMILAGIDPCFSCNDRMVFVKGHTDPKLMDWETLRQYGIEYYKK
jgi:NADH-quinone oxidoreductase subunit D